MHEDREIPPEPVSLADYRTFRVGLEASVENGTAYAADVERLKREYLGVAAIGNSDRPTQRQTRLRNLRRARVTASLTREAQLVS